jgi:hypothetical protein
MTPMDADRRNPRTYSGTELDLLLNFGASRLEYRRLILSQPHLRSSAAICG